VTGVQTCALPILGLDDVGLVCLSKYLNQLTHLNELNFDQKRIQNIGYKLKCYMLPIKIVLK
jgi:hypothetical protein